MALYGGSRFDFGIDEVPFLAILGASLLDFMNVVCHIVGYIERLRGTGPGEHNCTYSVLIVVVNRFLLAWQIWGPASRNDRQVQGSSSPGIRG